MQHRTSMRRVLARWCSFVRRPLPGAFFLLILLVLPGMASAAACPDFVLPDAHTTPRTSPMAPNTSITVDVSSCAPGGFFSGDPPSAPAHGTASIDPVAQVLTYTNRGDGSTTDHFTFKDETNQTVNVTVNIGPSTPPTANNVSATVAHGSSGNPITLSFTGAAATSASVATAPAHGVAIASGTSITYSPTASYAGTDIFTYTGTNGSGTSTPATVTITVTPPTVIYAPASPATGTRGTAYSQSLAGASGGTAPYTYTVTSGSLPTGITLASNGTLSGTPSVSGVFNVRVTATDSSTGTGPFSTPSGTLTLTIQSVPDAPTISSAVAGNGAATVTVSPPANNGGSAITTYTATASPGGATGTIAGAGGGPVTVTGLTNGVAYTFTATATNAVGTGPASAASASVTPKSPQTITFNNPGAQNFGTAPTLTATATSGLAVTWSSSSAACSISSGGTLTFLQAGICTIAADQAGNASFNAATQVQQSFQVIAIVPGAPTIGTATAQQAGATISFTAPASTGGAAITGYTVTSNPGGITGTGAASPLTVSGLTNGVSYTFSVTATNTAGTGNPSAASNSVTPQGSQVITFANPGSVNFGSPLTLAATTTSGLPVAFTTGTPAVCTVTGNQLTTVSPGNCTINADQAGNASYLPAARVSQTFAVVVPGGPVTITTASLPHATGGGAYSQTVTATGGFMPYTFSLSAGALPAGLSLNPSTGTISGTPTVSGSFSITVRVTDAATQTSDKALPLVVDAPALTVTPASLPPAIANKPFSQTLAASGGTAPYTFSISSGGLPAGIVLSPAGVLSGTASTATSASFTVTARDTFGFTGAQAYTFVIGEPAPVAVNDNVSAGANAVATIPVTVNDSGPITSIAIAQAPNHGSASVSGLSIVYTPAHDFFGTDTLTYTATGPGGTSAAATVTITVAAGAVPTAAAQSAAVLAGKSVTLHMATGATNGPFTALTIVTQPASGSVVVQGTDAVYTAVAEGSGTVSFDYTLSNAFGASAPARATVEVNAVPVAPSLTATAMAGSSVQVDLTSTARGGPFTAANLVSISPTNAGSATIQASANGYSLTFVAAAAFSGSAQLSYTLTNAYATSAAGTITIAVTQRSDPSKDAEVLGVLSAQADATRRMATGQIGNFQRRLEMLHSGGLTGFSNGISFASAGSQRGKDAYADLRNQRTDWNQRYLVQPDPDTSPAATGTRREGGSLPGDVAVWTGGAVNFGKSTAGTSGNGTDFTTSGLSFGVDKQFSPNLAVGVGVGYGHDNSDIGEHGSRSAVDSYNVAMYASYRPSDAFYTDALIGYQRLSFDARRYVTDNGNRVHGSRDGKQWFGSFSVGYLYRTDGAQLTPYGRLDIARARLDGYTEHGDAFYALSYQSQTVKTSTATVGLLAQWTAKRDYGVWAPQLRAEFGHDMQGASQAAMRYADLLDGPLYRATLQQQSREHTLLGAGIALQTLHGWLLRAEYQLQLDNTSRDNQSIQLGLEKKFDP